MNTRKFFVGVVVSVAASQIFSGFAVAKTWVVRNVEFVPQRCNRSDCWEQGQNKDEHAVPPLSKVHHGDVVLLYADGRRAAVTKKGNAVGNQDLQGFKQLGMLATANPQISPDRRTVGWTMGEHKKCEDWSIGGTMFVNSQLILLRQGKVLRTFKVPNTFITGWRFWNNGKYVAVGSRWHHGLGYVRLFDVNSGRLLERMSTPDANARKLRWAANLTP